MDKSDDAGSETGGRAKTGSEQQVKPVWTTAFLPTLYHNLLCSEKPFEDFQKGEPMIKRLQSIVDMVSPDSGTRVKWGDEFCQTVRW
jgi:hypothetical protein